MTTTEYIRLAAAILISIVCAAGLWYLWRPSKDSQTGLREARSGRKSRTAQTELLATEPRTKRRSKKAAAEPSLQDDADDSADIDRLTTGIEVPVGGDVPALDESATKAAEEGTSASSKRKSRRERRAAAKSSAQASKATLAEPGADQVVDGDPSVVADQTEDSEPSCEELPSAAAPTASAEPALLDGLFDLNRLQRENDELLGRDWFGGNDDTTVVAEEQPATQPAGSLPDSLGAMIGRAAISAASAESGEKVDPLQLLFAQTPLTEGAVVVADQGEDSLKASSDAPVIAGSKESSDDTWDASVSVIPAVDENAVREEQKRARRLEQAERRRIKAQKRRDRRAKNRDARQTEQRPPTKREIRRELRSSARAVKSEATKARRAERAEQKRQLKQDQQAMRANQHEAQKAAARKLGIDAAPMPVEDAWTTALTTVVAQPVVSDATLAVAPNETATTYAAPPIQPFGVPAGGQDVVINNEEADVWPAEEAVPEDAPEAVRLFGRDGSSKPNVLDQLFGEVVAMSEQESVWTESASHEATGMTSSSDSAAVLGVSQSQTQDPWSAAVINDTATWATHAATPVADASETPAEPYVAAPTPSHNAFGLPEPLPARNAPLQ